MNPLARVLRSRRTVALLWLVQLAVAWCVGAVVETVASAAARPYAWSDEESLLFGLGEMMQDHPTVPALVLALLALSAVLGALLWTLCFPALVVSLARAASFPEQAAASARKLPAMVVQGIYGLLLRLCVIGPLVAASIAAELGPWTAVPVLLLSGLVTVCLDRARAEIVLHDARRFSPRTLLRALKQTVARPRVTALGLGLVVAQWIVALVSLGLAIGAWLGPGSMWVVRVMAGIGVLLAAWRISAVSSDAQATQAFPHATPRESAAANEAPAAP